MVINDEQRCLSGGRVCHALVSHLEQKCKTVSTFAQWIAMPLALCHRIDLYAVGIKHLAKDSLAQRVASTL